MTPPTEPAAGSPDAGSLRAEHVVVDLGGRRVLDDVNLTLQAGRVVAITGPSGSGKTVLCLVLGGALHPTTGTVRLVGGTGAGSAADGGTGTPPSDANDESNASGEDGEYPAGLILQTHGLVAELTAEENVSLPLQARRLGREQIASRTARALGEVGLGRHASRPVDELSGGERQRVGIARALALDPMVLVADEPTSELDPGNRARVLSLLTELAARGRVVAIASDDPEVIAACAQVVTLERGAVVDVRATLDARA